MVYIIVRKSKSWQGQKDSLHRRRRELEGQIKEGIMPKSEMNRGEEGEPEFDERVQRYDRWKEKKEPLMREWSDINKEFKEHKEEGRPHSIDNLRPDGEKLKYD